VQNALGRSFSEEVYRLKNARGKVLDKMKRYKGVGGSATIEGRQASANEPGQFSIYSLEREGLRVDQD